LYASLPCDLTQISSTIHQEQLPIPRVTGLIKKAPFKGKNYETAGLG
jgi:hypothetical protein